MFYIYIYMRANTLSVCVNMFERMCKYIYIYIYMCVCMVICLRVDMQSYV